MLTGETGHIGCLRRASKKSRQFLPQRTRFSGRRTWKRPVDSHVDLIPTLYSSSNVCSCKRICTTGLGQLVSCAHTFFCFHFRSSVTQLPHGTQASSGPSRVLHGSHSANPHPPVPTILKTASHPFSDSSTNYILHPRQLATNWYCCPTHTQRNIRHFR